MEDLFFYHSGLHKEKIDYLTLPENTSRVSLLEDTLKDHQESLPGLVNICPPDEPALLMTMYQAQIIDWVLKEKNVNTSGLLTFASKQDFFNREIYEEAIRIVYDLCNTGGKYTTPSSWVK